MGKASRRKVAARTRELLNATQSRLKALGVDHPLVIRSDLPQEQKISNGISRMLDSEVGEDLSRGATPSFDSLINQDAARVGVGAIRPDLRPSEVGAHERVLGQLLGRLL